MEFREDLITGIWKFSDKVEVNELRQVAEKWAEEDRYIQLYIRQVSKDQNGIGFSCIYSGGKEAMDEYRYEVSDELRRQFGNDLVGWDISSSVHIIKGM